MAPINLAWFEFLLNPELLETHLKQKDPEPPALSLILQFIYNGMKKAEAIAARNDLGDGSTKTFDETKKKFLMGIIPLQLSSFLNWDLDLFSLELPLHIQNALLTLLLEETLAPEYHNPITHSTLDTGPLLPHQLYSVSLYHRWALSALIRSKLPLKPTKISNVPIPGQQDIMLESREVQDSILSLLKRDVDHSVRILEQLLTSGEVHSITMQAFSIHFSKEGSQQHRWNQCKLIPDEQFKCQIHYDLGYYHIMQEKMTDAFHHFSEAVSLLEEIGNSPEFCFFQPAKLLAFHKSCACICGRSTPVMDRNLYDRFTHALDHELEGIIDTLVEDNLKNEIPAYMRTCLQLDLTTNDRAPEQLLFQVQTLNVIRCVFCCEIWDSNYIVSLQQAGKQGAQYLIQMLGSSLQHLSSDQRNGTQTFLRSLCSTEGLCEILMSPLMACAPLLSLFEHEEIVRLWRGAKEQRDSVSPVSVTISPDKKSTNDLIWTLLHSYDPEIIKEYYLLYLKAPPIPQGSSKKHILDLKLAWESALHENLLITLRKTYQDPERSLMIVLLAKASELADAKNYDLARTLSEQALELAAVSQDRYNSPSCRLIDWLMLVRSIRQQIHDLPCVDESEIRNLATRSRACLAMSQENSPDRLVPWSDVTYWCRILLLNAQDWTTAIAPQYIPTNASGLMQLIKPHAIAAKCLHEKMSSKKPCLDLFECVIRILLTAPRENSSQMENRRDDSIITTSVYKEFLQTVKEPNCLSVTVSLFGHIFNCIVEEATCRVHTEHGGMWPPKKIANMDKSFRVVQDLLKFVVDHATTVYPLGANGSASVSDSWFITRGDLAFYKDKYHEAIQNYLTAIFVATDYLRNDTNVPEQNCMTDDLLRRFIRSFKKLGAFTQAAVLCQFLHPIDYNTAIQCLQERNAIDAMDAYYDCLWDVTLMEFIIHMHQKRGENQRRDTVMDIIGLLELNSNNNEEIQREAAKVRKHRFLRAMGKQYL